LKAFVSPLKSEHQFKQGDKMFHAPGVEIRSAT
jgi:hypothetical protein